MTQVFDFDVVVYATVYVRAGSEEEARVKARALADTAMQLRPGFYSDTLQVSALMLDNPNLPELSLSPALTIGGLADEAIVGKVLVEVRGGMAEVAEHPPGCTIEIIDHDAQVIVKGEDGEIDVVATLGANRAGGVS